MKRRKHLNASFKQAVLAVPAAALMLGAAHAGTTVGLNFQAWYYDSGATPQTVGYGFGYQTTGFPVTGKAFGIDVADWTNTDPLDCRAEINETITFGSGLTALVQAPNAWQSGIGELQDDWVPETVAPGDDEVTWGYLDDGNKTDGHPSVNVTGLKAKFPNGYVLQTIAANSGGSSFNDVDIKDSATTSTVAYSTYYVANAKGTTSGGHVGLTAQSSVFTADTIDIIPQPKTDGKRSVLAGFIITDKPVVTKKPANVTVNQGGQLVLDAGVIGIAPVNYQWQHAGTNVPGATTVPLVKAATAEDAGSWVLLASNAYGNGASVPANVTVIQVPLITKDLVAATNVAYAGSSTLLGVTVGGPEPLSYQWKRDGANILGANSASLKVSNATAGLAGYSVVVTNAYGTATSATTYIKTVATPDAYNAKVVEDAPIAFWPLGEASGTVAHDYSGNGYNGVVGTTLTLGSPGPRPPAFPGFASSTASYSFDGSADGFVDCGTAPALAGETDFSLEAWVNTTSGLMGRLMQQRSGYIGEYMFDITADGTVAFVVYGPGAYQFNFASTTSVMDGNWHHIAAVRQGTNGFIYIDGVEAATASGPIQALDPSFTVGLGKDIRDNKSFYNGLLAAPAIYNKALSASQILSHYAIAAGTAVTVTIEAATNGQITVNWSSGTLVSSPTLGSSANWQPVAGAQAPKYTVQPTGTTLYYRVQ